MTRPVQNINTLVQDAQAQDILATLPRHPTRGQLREAAELYADGSIQARDNRYDLVYTSVAFTSQRYLRRQ